MAFPTPIGSEYRGYGTCHRRLKLVLVRLPIAAVEILTNSATLQRPETQRTLIDTWPGGAHFRPNASPQMLMVVVNCPGSDATILRAMGTKISPWYSGVAVYWLTLPASTSGAITLLSIPVFTSAT